MGVAEFHDVGIRVFVLDLFNAAGVAVLLLGGARWQRVATRRVDGGRELCFEEGTVRGHGSVVCSDYVNVFRSGETLPLDSTHPTCCHHECEEPRSANNNLCKYKY